MSPPDPPRPQTFLGQMTQAIKTIHAQTNLAKAPLKQHARVPKLLIQKGITQPIEHTLLDDQFVIGRSSRCDIVIRNDIVSQIHASLERVNQRPGRFVLHDKRSTNGTYYRKQRIQSHELRHNDIISLGPPALENAVQVKYVYPPPWYVQGLRYLIYGVTAVVALASAVVAYEWQKFEVMPLPTYKQGPIVILSRDQTPVAQRQKQAHGELNSLDEFSPYLVDALLASEDSRYYWHFGIDPIGTARALVTNLSGGNRQGGSTITQQLARSLYHTHVGRDNTIARKYREAMVSLKLETFYTKDFLLLTYLNKVYLGIHANGFEDAARFYFDKPAKDLDISEAATLVGILPAPNRFNPVQDPKAALFYRDRVISRMAAQRRITQDEANSARRSVIKISPKATEQLQSNRAPYYYNYVFKELENLLPTLAQEGNFIIETGLDLKMQATAEQALKTYVQKNGQSFGFEQGAIATLDSKSGELRALVGGVDYSQSQFDRVTQAVRQPGSTFKLFSYAAALQRGISPGRTYECSPLNWRGLAYNACRTGSEPMDMFRGMALSENPVALRVARDAGLERVVQTARTLGIDAPLDAVPGVVLGQNEVTVLELSRAYGVVANQGQAMVASDGFAVTTASGRKAPPVTIRRVLDAANCTNPQDIQTCRVIYDRADHIKPAQLMQRGVANVLTRMLRGVVTNGTGRSARLNLYTAGKTGTTDNSRDLWFVGFVRPRNLVTGVWLGNDQNQPTRGSSAQAAALWGQYMRKVIQ